MVLVWFVFSLPWRQVKTDPESYGGTNNNCVKAHWLTEVSLCTYNVHSEGSKNGDSWHGKSAQSPEIKFLALTLMRAEQWPISHWYFPWPPGSTLHCPLRAGYSNNAGMRSNRSPTAFRNWTSKTLSGYGKGGKDHKKHFQTEKHQDSLSCYNFSFALVESSYGVYEIPAHKVQML